MTQESCHAMWTELGLHIERHDEMLEALSRAFTRTHLWQSSRPRAMRHFDDGFHASHASRVAEIRDHRKKGGKSIGTFCIYVPDEIALAAGVVPIPLCGGTNWSVSHADRMFPRDICPIVRSTFGMAFAGTCPFETLKDLAVGETTCDAKKKAWDLMGFEALEVPQKKKPFDRELWRQEVRGFKDMVESLAGVTITREKLGEAIALCDRRRELLQEINALRALDEPPISGLDALLVSQVALSQDIRRFIEGAESLLDELRDRVRGGIGAYERPGMRIVLAGSPSPLGNAKVHWIVESSGMRIVADESCTGMRYFRDLVGPVSGDLDVMIAAIADRYLQIDCACFSPNRERMENVRAAVERYRAQGVVHNVLQFCHGFDIEAKALDRMLSRDGIPSIKIVTDYSEEDVERIRVRLEAFREVAGH